MTQEIAKVLVQWETDPASTAQSLAEAQKIIDKFGGVSKGAQETVANIQAVLKSIQGLSVTNDQLKVQYNWFDVTKQKVAELNAELTKMQAGRGSGGLLGANATATGVSAGFMAELQAIQASEAGRAGVEQGITLSLQQQFEAMYQQQQLAAQVTGQQEAQVTLADRLNQAAAERATHELDYLNTLEQEATASINNRNPSANFPIGGGEDTGGGGAGGLLGGGGLTGNRRAISALGSLLGSSLGGGALSEVARVVTLGAAFGAAGVLIGVAAIALHNEEEARKAAVKEIDDTVAALNKEADARSQLAQTIAQGNPSAIDQQVQALKAQQENISSQVIQPIFDKIRTLTSSLGVGFSYQPTGVDSLIPGEYGQQLAQLTELNKQWGEAETKILDIGTQINDLAQQGKQGALVVKQINDVLSEAAARRDLGQSSDVGGVTTTVENLQDDLATGAQQIAQADAAITAARAAGHEAEAQGLEAFAATLQAKQDERQSNLDLYVSMLPVIIANKQLADQQAAALKDAQGFASAELEADRLTSDQRATRVDEINREIQVYTLASQRAGLSTDAIKSFSDQIDGLAQERDILGSVAQSAADITAAAKALSDETDNLFKAEQTLGDATDKLNEAETSLTEARNKHAIAITTIEDDQAFRDINAATKRETDINAARAKAARELGRQLEDIQKSSDKRIEQIKTEGTHNIEKLVANGDQLAAITALEDQAFAIKQERAKEQDAEKEKRATISSSLDEQLITIQAAYDREIKASAEQYEKALNQEAIRWDEESKMRQRAVDEALRDETNAAASVKAIQDTMHAQGVFNEAYYGDARNQALASGLQIGVGIVAARVAEINGLLSGLSGGSARGFDSDPNTGNFSRFNQNRRATSPYGTAIDAGLSQEVALALQQFYSSYHNPNAGVQRGSLFVPEFDDGGISTGAGYYRTGNIREMHIPLTEKHSLDTNMFGGQTTINVYPSPGMDEQALARLVAQKLKDAKPALVNEISTNMGKQYQNARRR